MAQHSSEAFLLQVIDLHEGDRIVSFLTPWMGRKRGVARGARRRHSRFAGLLQPLARVRIDWWEKERSELVRVRDVELVRSAHALQSDLEGILLSACLAEHLEAFTQENEDCRLFFRLLDATLRALGDGLDRTLAARYFEVWVLRLSGIFPPVGECSLCGRDLSAGAVLPASGEGFSCRRCAGGGDAGGATSVPAETLELLARFARESPGSLAEAPPRSAALRGVEEVAGRVRRAFLNRELKSYRVMRRTLAAGVGGPAEGV